MKSVLKGIPHLHSKVVSKYEEGGKVTEAQRVGAAASAHSKANDDLYDAGREPSRGGVYNRAQNNKMARLSDASNSTQTDYETAKKQAGDDQ
jgi:hypothetical protein